MKYLGTWKTKKVAIFGPEGAEHLTVEEMAERGLIEENEDAMKLFASFIVINEDKTIDQFVRLPQEVVEQARAEGAPVDENGCINVGSAAWDEKDGGYVCIMDGQETPLEADAEGYIPFAMGMMLMERE